MASDINVLPTGRQESIVIASISSTASIVLLERSSVAVEEGPLGGLGLVFFTAFAVLVLYAIVGRILALFLATTRREVSLLDCTARGADEPDVRVMVDDFFSANPGLDGSTYPQTRVFEWIDTPSEAEYAERLHG
jgi:hypothetical protein